MAKTLATNDARGRLLMAGRVMAGLDQDQLARRSGVSAATISNIERGNGGRDETISSIRSALRKSGVSVLWDTKNGLASVSLVYEKPDSEE